MADLTLNVKLQEAYDTEANWRSANPVLLKGQIAISSDKSGMYKVGDGSKTWTNLSYNTANTLNGLTATIGELNTLDGVTATTAEINKLDGVTATTAEINKLSGLTATTTELNYTDGVTSNIQTQLNNKAKGASKSANTAATAGWYRFATSSSSINNCIGTFEIVGSVSGKHTVATISASTSYGYNSNISVLQCSHYANPAISKVRIVYHQTYSENYAYLEAYVPTAVATSISVKMIGGSAWSLVAPSTAGSIPSGYSSKEATLSDGTMYSPIVKAGTMNTTGDITTTVSDATYISHKVTNSNGSVGLHAAVNRGLYDFTNSKWLVYTGGNGTILNGDATGNAGTATILKTARTIAISGGATGTATSFNGSANISIPVTAVKEAYLSWGGKNLSGTFGPIDAAMVPELGANRLAFMPSSSITIEYSRDGGTTWADYGAGTDAKVNLFNGNGTILTIGASTATKTDKSNYMVRVTIDMKTANLYTSLNKFCILISTGGSTGSYCTITGRTGANYTNNVDTWKTFVNQQSISGWSGYNIINTSMTVSGNHDDYYRQLRFTFGVTSHASTVTHPGLQINKIMGFGGVGWTTPSTMAKYGRMYTYDASKNVTFPAKVTATSFSGSLTGNADSATCATSVKITETNPSSSASYYPVWTAGLSADTNYSLRGSTGFKYNIKEGTTSADGFGEMVIGNSTASGTAGNKYGALVLYSPSSSYGIIKQTSTSSAITHTLPATTGTILNTGTTSFTQTLTSGTEVGKIKINGTTTTLYAPTNTDTKNTAGSTDSSSKLFLIGATSQATNPQTYSHNTAYVGTDGCLYSNSTKVSVEGHTHSAATTSAAGFMSTTDKKRLDSLTSGYSLGGMSGKTGADLKSALDTWLASYCNIIGASATFSGSDSWVTAWADSTATIAAGGTWTVTVISKYSTKSYVQLRFSYYTDEAVYYVHRSNDAWGTVHKAAYKDDLSSYLPLTGGTLTGGLTTPALTINNTDIATALTVSRPSYNYFLAPASGKFAFVSNGKGTGLANSDLVIENGAIYPGTTGVTTLGTSSYKWSNVYATTFTGALSGNASSSTYATYARVTSTQPTTATSYYGIWTTGLTSGTNYDLRANDGFKYNCLQGTASALGYSIVQLGNSTASGTAGNKYGMVRLYTTGTGYTNLSTRSHSSAATSYLPTGTNSYLTWTASAAAVGNSRLPVYADSAGQLVACGCALRNIQYGTAAPASGFSGTPVAGDIYVVIS